jgi:transposase
MTDKELLRQMLGITDPWDIKTVQLDREAKQLRIEVQCTQAHWADENGRKLPVHGYVDREWRHLDAFQFQTVIYGRVPRVRYPEDPPPGDDDGSCASTRSGRTGVVNVPWAERFSRWTRLFERFAIEIILACRNHKDAADILGLSWDEVQRIQQRAVARGLERRVDEAIPFVGIDEKSFGRGHDYATVVFDLSGRRVLDVGPGRKQSDAEAVLKAAIATEHLEEVTAISMDMSRSFIAAAAAVIPGASVVFDRFHVSQLLNKGIDQVRRAEHKRLRAQGDESLKKTRYQWLIAPENMGEEQRAQFELIFAGNAIVSRAWTDRENFALFWESKSEGEARALFKKWERTVHRRRGHEPMKKVAATLRRHLEGLLNYISHPISNGFAEGINSLIAVLKGAARGLRNFANFRTRILFFHGKLNLLPE